MDFKTLANTGLDTVITTGALVSSPSVDIQEPKALILALATSVCVQLAIRGLQWLGKKIANIGRKDNDDNRPNDNTAVSSVPSIR
ncbi:hypothetical protein ACR79P_06470 [Sphingobacterium spiritivorum]|uniref:hypothetical protein n=1 Tax=Sphingobacterium spiritivorum TaxID=258 RepID=UPI003DA3127F